MSSNITKSKLNYAKLRNNKLKQNDEQAEQDQPKTTQTKQILGGEQDYDNLFSYMNKDNLNYIKNQIKEKHKKKNSHYRTKSSMPQIVSEPVAKQQRNTHREVNYDYEDRISQLEAYQQETSRHIDNKESPADWKFSEKYLKQEPEPTSQLERKQPQKQGPQFEEVEDTFMSFLSDYIETIKKRPTTYRKSKQNSVVSKSNKQKVSDVKETSTEEKKAICTKLKYENTKLINQLDIICQIRQNHQKEIKKITLKNETLMEYLRKQERQARQKDKYLQIKSLILKETENQPRHLKNKHKHDFSREIQDQYQQYYAFSNTDIHKRNSFRH